MNGDWPGDDPFEHPGFGADHLGADHLGTDHLGSDDPSADDLGTGHLGLDDPGTDNPGTDHLGSDDDLSADDPGTDHLGSDDPGADAPGIDEPFGHDPAEHDHLGAPEHPAVVEPAVQHEPAPSEVAPPQEHPAAAGADHVDTLPQHVDASPFPPYLEVDVTPADGQDWVDPYLLGAPERAFTPDTDPRAALHHLAAAEGADPARSEDPAIRALALFWATTPQA
jgi:hypothetical protein